jgi:hypothetical protein
MNRERAALEDPHLGHGEAVVDGELVEHRARLDHFEDDVREGAVDELAPDHPALVGLGASLLGLDPERRGPVPVQRQTERERVGLDEASHDLLDRLVGARRGHDLERSLQVRHPKTRHLERLAQDDVVLPANAVDHDPLLGEKPRREGRCRSHWRQHSARYV